MRQIKAKGYRKVLAWVLFFICVVLVYFLLQSFCSNELRKTLVEKFLESPRNSHEQVVLLESTLKTIRSHEKEALEEVLILLRNDQISYESLPVAIGALFSVRTERANKILLAEFDRRAERVNEIMIFLPHLAVMKKPSREFAEHVVALRDKTPSPFLRVNLDLVLGGMLRQCDRDSDLALYLEYLIEDLWVHGVDGVSPQKQLIHAIEVSGNTGDSYFRPKIESHLNDKSSEVRQAADFAMRFQDTKNRKGIF